MKAAFLVKDLQLSGGVNVVVEHARQLARRHGFEPVLVRTHVQPMPDWPYPGLRDLRVATLDEVAGERFDVAVATWWETAMRLFDVDAGRYAYFVQLLEDSHYPDGAPQRLGFALTLDLPVSFLTEARWIADAIEALQPGAPVLYVRNGIAKEVFAPVDAVPPAPAGEPLRVVIEGNPSLTRKGVPHAIEAVGLMREPRHVTLVSGAAAEEPVAGVDEHLVGLSHPEMAALFDRSHVMVKLSRAEGMYGPPLEAFHRGATVVTNPVSGHEEYVRHGENGLVVDWDDPVGTARALDLLAHDRRLLHRLRTGALETARAWPSWERSGELMAAALRAIAGGPPPDPVPPGRRLAADVAAVLAEAERLELAEKATFGLLAALRGEKAVRAAIRARNSVSPALAAARRARGRLRRG